MMVIAVLPLFQAMSPFTNTVLITLAEVCLSSFEMEFLSE